MNPCTLNCARMLEHRIQHLTEMPKTCWNIVSNIANMNICFRNNAANTNTLQSPPLSNFLVKQIKANNIRQRDTQVHFSNQYEHTPMKKTSNTYNIKRYLS